MTHSGTRCLHRRRSRYPGTRHCSQHLGTRLLHGDCFSKLVHQLFWKDLACCVFKFSSVLSNFAQTSQIQLFTIWRLPSSTIGERNSAANTAKGNFVDQPSFWEECLCNPNLLREIICPPALTLHSVCLSDAGTDKSLLAQCSDRTDVSCRTNISS